MHDTDRVARDEGPREDAIDHNRRTSETIGRDVGVGDGEVGLGSDACISRGGEKQGDVGEQRLEPRHCDEDEEGWLKTRMRLGLGWDDASPCILYTPPPKRARQRRTWKRRQPVPLPVHDAG